MKSYSVSYTHPAPFHATLADVMAVDAADAANIVEAKYPGAEVVAVVLEKYNGLPECDRAMIGGDL
jgi:hypothetical protein